MKVVPRPRKGPQGVIIHGSKVWELQEDVQIFGKARKDEVRKTGQPNRALPLTKSEKDRKQGAIKPERASPTAPPPANVPPPTQTPSVAAQPSTGYLISDADRTVLSNNRYSGPRPAPPAEYPRYPWDTAGSKAEGSAEAPSASYPTDVAKLSAWLIRQGYIREVTKLISPDWRSMSEEGLTRELASRFTEEELIAKFEGLSAQRQSIKGVARKGGVASAFVVGLIWARENIKHDEWGTAIAKVSAATISAALLNRVLYARDKSAAKIMADNAGRFGKWFQGVARTNKLINRLTDVGMVSVVAQIGLSGGGEYPSIPFDVIYDVDIDDPKTWRPPNQSLLDYGFNVWYRQKATAAYPEAASGNVYLGTVYGVPIPVLYGLIKDAFGAGPAY